MYHLEAIGGSPINVSDLSVAVHKLSAEDCDLFGTKTFNSIPKVASTIDYSKQTIMDNMVPTIGYVKGLVAGNGDYLTEDLVVVG